MKCVNGVRHLVIGTSAENHGVRAEMVEELQDFMYTSFFRGVTLDYSEFTNTLAVVKGSDELARRRIAEKKRSAPLGGRNKPRKPWGARGDGRGASGLHVYQLFSRRHA